MKARYWIVLGAIGCGIAYKCTRGDPDDVSVEIDTNLHICSAVKAGQVMKALTDVGFTASKDDRIANANVIEVPPDESERALEVVKQLQTEHPEYGIVIRTDKFGAQKRR